MNIQTGMTIYLCPSDKKYTCSWEGPAEDILIHFEQEHDDLLHFNDTFSIDLMISSENRLFLVDEEIYLTQTVVTDKILVIKLRYLGPIKYANKISYNIILKAFDQICYPGLITTTPEGALEVDLIKLESEFPGVQQLSCTLNIMKNFNSNDSDNDSVFNEEIVASENVENFIPDTPLPRRKFSLEDHDQTIPLEKVLSKSKEDVVIDDEEEPTFNDPITLSRSKTITFEDIKRKNVRRTKSNLSLGPIQENDNAINCFDCDAILQPPIFLCPCGQNFCQKCQLGTCKVCEEKITFERNIELEDKYNKYLYPCKHKKLGCPEKLIYTELHRHETNCSFCEYKCPMDECKFEGQYKALVKHLKLIHGSTKILESFIVVFQHVPEAFLVNEEKGIFHCYVQYSQDSVLWEAKFCGPKERSFFCELKFKDGKLKQPVLLRRIENIYSVRMSFNDLKRLKLKAKNAILTISG